MRWINCEHDVLKITKDYFPALRKTPMLTTTSCSKLQQAAASRISSISMGPSSWIRGKYLLKKWERTNLNKEKCLETVDKLIRWQLLLITHKACLSLNFLYQILLLLDDTKLRDPKIKKNIKSFQADFHRFKRSMSQ